MSRELDEFAAHLAGMERASAHTQRAYLSDLRQLAAFLEGRGLTLDAATRDDLRAFLAPRCPTSSRSTTASPCSRRPARAPRPACATAARWSCSTGRGCACPS